MAADPQVKPTDLGCESSSPSVDCYRSTTNITIYYYYSARKLILIYSPTDDGRLSGLRHHRSAHPVFHVFFSTCCHELFNDAFSKLYIVCIEKNESY